MSAVRKEERKESRQLEHSEPERRPSYRHFHSVRVPKAAEHMQDRLDSNKLLSVSLDSIKERSHEASDQQSYRDS